MKDSQIIDLFFERSEQAITELSNKYGKLCKSISYNIVNNDEDAEECVNDAYFGAWNRIPPDKPNPLMAYICKLVRNISLNKFDYNNAKKRNSNYTVCLDELDECVPAANSVEDEINTKRLTVAIENFLSELDEVSRIIFVRRYWFYDDYAQIAAGLGIKEGNVRVKLGRTRKKLKNYLEKEGFAI